MKIRIMAIPLSATPRFDLRIKKYIVNCVGERSAILHTDGGRMDAMVYQILGYRISAGILNLEFCLFGGLSYLVGNALS